MKRIIRSTVAVMVMATALALTSCATQPMNPTEDVVVEQTSLTVATNALADLHDKEMIRQEAVKRGEIADSKPLISDANYQIAKQAAVDATDILKRAGAAARSGDYTRSQALIIQATDLINKIAAYNGGKK